MHNINIFWGIGLLCCFIGISIYFRRVFAILQIRSKERKRYSLVNLYRRGLLQDRLVHKKSGNKKIFP
jgi:hypothetical protein